MHSGIDDPADVEVNKTSGRAQYSGPALALAKAVGDSGSGGMVLLSQASFERLPVSALKGLGMLLNMGGCKRRGSPAMVFLGGGGGGLDGHDGLMVIMVGGWVPTHCR